MNFQNSTGGDCGGINPLAQFAQHMVQDVARQDSVSQPSTSSGLASNNFMTPQSFRMHDLMNEMEAIQPRRSYVPAITPPDSQWITEYQESGEYTNMMCSRDQSLWNIGLPGPQVYLPSYPQQNFQPKLEKKAPYIDSKSGGIIVASLDQLNDIYQCEEQGNQPLESKVQQDTEPKPAKHQKYWKGIPIEEESVVTKRLATYTEVHTYLLCLWDYGGKCNDEDWKLRNPNRTYESDFTKENLLKHKDDNEYPYIKYNPMRDCDDPLASSHREWHRGNMDTAIFYADEAARQNPEDINRWFHLHNLYQIELENYESFFVAQQIIRLDPSSSFAHKMVCISYLQVRCFYEAFEMMVHWLKNHESYGDIPLNFSMVENSSGLDGHIETWIESNRHIVDGVINMLLTAARRNPTNADFNVQSFLSFIFYLTKEYAKSSDCLTTISRSKPKHLRSPHSCYNAGYNLLLAGKPREALEDLLIVFKKSKNKVKLMMGELIGVIYMYLTNYREAIWFFKAALKIDPTDEEFALPTRGDILKAENELCLLLFSNLYKKINPKHGLPCYRSEPDVYE